MAFDIDGTLYPSFGLYLINLGMAARNWRMMRGFARVRRELHDRAANITDRSTMPKDLAGFRDLQSRLLAEATGCSVDEAAAWSENIMYGELELSFHQVRTFPGVLPALDAFRDAGLKLAALSDFPAPRKLEILGIRDRFSVALSSEESGLLKPAPDPFLSVARDLGLEPSQILYVGNSLALDVAGAKGVGMMTALRGSLKSSFREPYVPRRVEGGEARVPELVFTDWADLVSFVLPSRAGIGVALQDGLS